MKKLLGIIFMLFVGFTLVACEVEEDKPTPEDEIEDVIPEEDENVIPEEDKEPEVDEEDKEPEIEEEDKEPVIDEEDEEPVIDEEDEEDVDVPNIIESSIVFYEIYSHGGNKDATFKHDYVLLKNTTDQTIDLSGLFIQYASKTGKFGTRTTALSGEILPNQTFKIKLVSHSDQGEDFESDLDLSSVDSKSDINLAGTSGQIGITNSHIKGSYEEFKDNFITYIEYSQTGANNSVIVEDDGTLSKNPF